MDDEIIREANAGKNLAEALDRFYSDLRYTAPEMVGQRLNELGARITEPMRAFGYPRDEGADGEEGSLMGAMVERAARVLWEDDQSEHDVSWEPNRDAYRDLARRVLVVAMGRPQEEGGAS